MAAAKKAKMKAAKWKKMWHESGGIGEAKWRRRGGMAKAYGGIWQSKSENNAMYQRNNASVTTIKRQ
jgi:hypothetical protein